MKVTINTTNSITTNTNSILVTAARLVFIINSLFAYISPLLHNNKHGAH